jgi:hypothetical protein
MNTSRQVISSIWDGTNLEASVTTTDTLTLSSWSFIVITYTSSSGVLSVSIDDGTPVTDTAAGAPGTTAAVQYVGGASTADYFDGLMDQWCKFFRVLSAAEITWLYNSGSGRSFEEMQTLDSGGSSPVFIGGVNTTFFE